MSTSAWTSGATGLVSVGLDVRMDFVKTSEGTYVHDDKTFFPIDGRGWNDSRIGLDNKSHNFFFTLEMSTSFVYIPGQSFTFRGDDDVWVFMNDQLVIDLGGVHNPMEKSFSVDDLNLTEGHPTSGLKPKATESHGLHAFKPVIHLLGCCEASRRLPGEAVDLRFFFAERRCCGSEFRMETSIVPVTGTCTIWGDVLRACGRHGYCLKA